MINASFFDEIEKIGGIRSGLKTLLTGRVPLFHGTTAERAAQIAEKGLIPHGSPGVTQLFPELAAKERNLAFTTLSKGGARMYAGQQAGMDGLKHMHGTLGSIVRADVPRDFLKEHATLGQELPWALEWTRKNRVVSRPKRKLQELKKAFLTSFDVPVQGGIPPKYIRGPFYSPVTINEIKQHIKNTISDPVGVGKDVLRSTLGVAHRPSTLLKNPSIPSGTTPPVSW